MLIEIKDSEIIKMSEFRLNWRWQKPHNPDIKNEELELINPLSEKESKRLYKLIEHYEISSSWQGEYIESGWHTANSDSDMSIMKFSIGIAKMIVDFNENVVISWDDTTSLKTTKEIFLKYWDDFFYPSSDDVIVLSVRTNWILIYRHYEVANLWIKNLK